MAEKKIYKEMELDKLEEMPVGKGIDFSEYEGARVKVEACTPIEVKTDYDEAGNFKQGLQRPVWVLRVQTAPVVTTENKLGEEVLIRASELCNLKKDGDRVGWSNHPESKIQKIFAKYKAKSPTDLIGKTVTVTVREKGEKQFFGIVY